MAKHDIKNKPYYCILPTKPIFKHILGVDTETHLITEDEPIPDLVCISFSRLIGPSKRRLYGGTLADKICGVNLMLDALEDPDTCIVGHNIFFDISVILRFLIKLYPEQELQLTQRFFKYFRDGKIRDTGVVAKLIAIRTDWLRYDPKVGGPHEFNLEFLVRRYLKIDMVGKHGPDVWRKRFSELDNIPIELWPKEASDYAILDAVYVFDLLSLFYLNFSSPDEIFQTEAAWILHLMGVHGLYPDIEKAIALEEKITPIIEEAQRNLIEQGVYREPEYTIQRQILKDEIKRVLTDQTILTNKRDVSLSEKQLKNAASVGSTIIKDFLHHKDDKKKLCELGLAVKEEPTKNMEFIKKEIFSYLGRDAPLTEAGDKATLEFKLKALAEGSDKVELPDEEYVKYVSTDRATLEQVPSLLELAAIGEIYKIKTTYIPIFKKGKILHPFWNVLVASGRVSVSNPNPNNMPRTHGVRECFRARPGHVLLSTDYSQAELCSLAQITYDKFGFSMMREAINDGKDLHLLFVSKLLEEDYKEICDQYKSGEKKIKDLRQLGKCFHPDTEVLTKTGWIKIIDLKEGIEIAAAFPNQDGEVVIEWQIPTNIFSKPYKGNLVHLQNEGINIRVTPDHRMVAYCAKKNGKPGSPKVVLPEELNSVRFFPNAGVYKNESFSEDERLLRLAIATQADGNYSSEGLQIKFGFSKQRKIDRLLSLLNEGEYKIAEYTNGKSEKKTTAIVIHAELASKIKKLLDPDKTFSWKYLNFSLTDRQIILDEVKYWDSRIVSGNSFSYFSSVQKNIDVLQAIAHITGNKTKKYVTVSANENRKDCYTLAIKSNILSRGENIGTSLVPYDGLVTCLSVPSSFILVRDGGTPIICGQCLNFGLPGGLGADKFVEFAKATYDVVLTKQQVVELKKKWLETFPEVEEYFNWIRDQLPKRDWSDKLAPRGSFDITSHRSGRVRGKVGYCDGANNLFQSLTADGAKQALIMIGHAMYCEPESPLFGCRIEAFIYDEMLIEAPEERAHEACLELERLMIIGMNMFVPDVKIKVESEMMYNWSKTAKAVYENGRLVPYDKVA